MVEAIQKRDRGHSGLRRDEGADLVGALQPAGAADRRAGQRATSIAEGQPLGIMQTREQRDNIAGVKASPAPVVSMGAMKPAVFGKPSASPECTQPLAAPLQQHLANAEPEAGHAGRSTSPSR